jgi:threonine aldolase
LAEYDIKASAFGPQLVRFVTHLDVDDAAIERVLTALRAVPEYAFGETRV